MKLEKNIEKKIIDVLLVSVGCLLLAYAITSILKPNGLMTGGITGTSIILEKLLKINYSYIYYALSLMVLFLAWITLGKKEAYKIITLSTLFPLLLILFEKNPTPLIENDTFLATIYYGIIAGGGCGLVLKRGFSMGGTDTISKILHKKLLPTISLSQVILVVDSLIVIASGVLFDRTVALYAILTQIVFMKTLETVMFGLSAKTIKIEIITEKHQEVSNYILKEINRGISVYAIKGGYTNQEKQKIVSICSPREAMLIRMYISQIDENAFVDVLPVISVWGKGLGFQSIVENEA
ncbi:YitT family protein [Alkaliphilus transvaalensis]|uniref:YitT family protein n=1 Tax=Alkaliphilus transvaalensis TaxID=114628 RepID=UPI000685885A|nr:YitT family protein [Alkaliphilus transvaalensis]